MSKSKTANRHSGGNTTAILVQRPHGGLGYVSVSSLHQTIPTCHYRTAKAILFLSWRAAKAICRRDPVRGIRIMDALSRLQRRRIWEQR
jgi:hypothetical protein